VELITALKAGSEAISLGAELAKLIKTLRADGDKNEKQTALADILQRLQVEALSLSRDFGYRLRQQVEELKELGIDPELTIEDHISNLRWYNFRSRSRLKAFREECFSLHRQLTTFLDDVTAVLICNNRVEDAKEAFQEAFNTKNRLDKLIMSPTTPISVVIEEMLLINNHVSAELRGA
jgi:hypothetical protein